jgi:6-pyruvoyl-tetrahydropterin synthase related domain
MTAFKTYPLILYFGTYIPYNFEDPLSVTWVLGDPLLVIWVLSWDFHALTTDPWKLFNANIFYPTENALAFSEHLIGVLPLFAPVYALTGNPILAYNAVFFLSFTLSGVAMFLLVHYWTQNFWASLVSGFLFAFAPVRFGQLWHPQLLTLYWAPVAFLSLEKFLRNKRWRDLVGFALFYWLQVLSSIYLGWFVTIAVVLYVFYYAWSIDRGLLKRSMLTRYISFATLSLLVLVPFHLPYYHVKQQWGFSRSLQDCVSFSADLLLSPLSVPPLLNDLYRSLFRVASSSYAPHEKWLFPGFIMPILVGVGSLCVPRFLASDITMRMKRIFGIILVASCLLSLGPYLVMLDRNTLIPLPYLLLYYVVPGFDAMRVPARFALMAVLAASVLAAPGFLQVCAVLNARRGFRRLATPTCQALLALACLGLFTLELGYKHLPPLRLGTGRAVPEVYRWLAARHLDGPIVELPYGLWEDPHYMYFSTYHWLPIVNGYTGFFPPTYAQIVPLLEALPSQKAIEALSVIGVKGVVVHLDQLEPQEALRWRQAPLAEIGLEKVAEFQSDLVYKIATSADSTQQLHIELAIPERLSSGARLTVGLHAQGVDRHLWAHPQPLGQTSARLEWEEQRTKKTSSQEGKVQLPLAIRAGEVSWLGLPTRAPSAPGHYLLRAYFPALDISTTPRVVELTADPFVTSRNAPHLLSAAFIIEGVPLERITSKTVTISLNVVNTGGAVWLAHAEGDRGAVRLGWRWFKGEQEVPFAEGRELLRHDVFPRQSHVFQTRINTPVEPGEYTLQLGLVSEFLTWFFDQDGQPLTVAVTVRARN